MTVTTKSGWSVEKVLQAVDLLRLGSDFKKKYDIFMQDSVFFKDGSSRLRPIIKAQVRVGLISQLKYCYSNN